MASEPTKITINRPLLGVISLGCLALWIYLYIRYPDAEGDLLMWQGGFMRAGLLTGAFWFALPSKNREAAWANVSPLTLAGMIGGIVAVAARPRIFVPLLGILAIIGFFLRPRRGARDQRPDREWKGS